MVAKDMNAMSNEEMMAYFKSPEWTNEVEARALAKAQMVAAWKARAVQPLASLPFVGRAYRSRGRRSANRMTAWAVKPPECTSEAAALGSAYALEFADMALHSENAKICGTGFLLEAVIVGMADALAKATPQDREQHIACIRGFAGVLESCASSWLAGGIVSDASDAERHQTCLAHLSAIQARMRLNNAPSRKHKNKDVTRALIAGVPF